MCELCRGVSNGGCPCEESPKYEECDHCDGEGYIYYNIDGEEITRVIYDLLPESLRDSEKCDDCDGLGEVIEEKTHPNEWEW